MALTFWLAVRQARELIRDGQLDAAGRLLAPLAAQGYRKAAQLQRDLAQAYLDRAARHQAAADADAAWTDLHAAESLVPEAARNTALRDALTRLGVDQTATALVLGHPLRALHAAQRLAEHGVKSPPLTALSDAARAWLDAADLADRGDFPAAIELLSAARRPLAGPAAAGIDRVLVDLRGRAGQFAGGVGPLTAAAANGNWPEAARLAERLLALAPARADIRSLGARAWAALKPDSHPPAGRPVFDSAVPLIRTAVFTGAAGTSEGAADAFVETTYFSGAAAGVGSSGGRSSARPSSRFQSGPDHTPGTPLPKRFMLWVDGVGGYLVCLGSRVTVGQAIGDAPVDVPVFAELAKLHAEIVRDADGGYVLEAARDATVNGRPVPRAVLSAGDRITLGASCQLLFHRPVAISATARLDVVSGHRLPWAVDGILLMDQSVMLGEAGRAHLSWPDDDGPGAILHRTKDGLALKCPGKFRVDNRPCQDRADLPLPGVVTGDGFTFALDPIGPRV